MLALGLNVWVIGALWPGLGGDWRASALLPVLVLALGVALLGREPQLRMLPSAWRDATPGALLLSLFPASIALAVTTRPAGEIHRALGPLPLSLLVLSLLAYGGVVAALATARLHPMKADHAPLPSKRGEAPGGPRLRPRLRMAYVALILAGAFAVGVIAPVLGGLGALQKAWGETALEGGLLTSVVAAALATGTVALLLGDALRGTPQHPTLPQQRDTKVATLLFLTLLGTVTYFVIFG